MTDVVQRLADLPRQFTTRYVEEAPNPEHFDILDLECVNRVTHLPLVASVLDYAQGVYESAKDSRVPLLGFALEAAEATAKYAVSQAQPVANFFEGPIHLVDTIACKGIDVLETAVPVVNQPADEVVKQARSYVAAKVQPTAELFSRVVDVSQEVGREAVHRGMDMAEGGVEMAGAAKDVTMEAAGSLAGAAKDTAEFGMKKTAETAMFGKEMAMESMRFGREKTAEAMQFGREKADHALEFGREKAMKAAKSQYGQMAAKQLDKAAIMADTMTDMYMPPEVAADVRKRGPVDVKRRTEEWEPKLRPLGHSMAIGEKLFQKFIALFFWQFNMALNVASFFMMPMLHPLKFADMMITQTFRAPPVIANLANRAFNLWKTMMNPWKVGYAMFDITRSVQRRGIQMLRDFIRFIYFHYVPEEIIQTARQTRSKMEETKFTAPEFGKSLPQGRRRSEEASEGASGYHSEEHEHHEEERAPHHRMSLGGEERKTTHAAGGKHRGKQQRPTWDYMRREEHAHHGQHGQQHQAKEQHKTEAQHKKTEHHGEHKVEAPSTTSKPYRQPEQHQRKPKHEKAFGEREASNPIEDIVSRGKLKERQGEMEKVPAHEEHAESSEQTEKVPKETGVEQPKEEDKENIGSRLWSGLKDIVNTGKDVVTTGGGLLEGPGGEEQEKPEEMKQPQEEKHEQQGKKSDEGSGISGSVPTPAGDVSAGVGGKLGEGEAKVEGSFSAPGLGEVSGKAGLERRSEEHEESGEKKERHVGGEGEHEILRGAKERAHGHHKGRQHHHHEKGVKEDFHKYEDLSHDENWVRENMPSVPVERKSPTHHDVVEEGVIPEALHELTDEEQAVPGTPSADAAGKKQKEGGQRTEIGGHKDESKRQEPQEVSKDQQQHYQQEQGKVEMASPEQVQQLMSAPAPEEHGFGLGRVEMGHEKQGGAGPYAIHDVVGSPTAVEKTVD